LQGNLAPSKKNAQEIPTPQFDDVETYERDYTRTFAQPSAYIRGRGGIFLIDALELPFLH
jgi:enhancer of polycomb-like protein